MSERYAIRVRLELVDLDHGGKVQTYEDWYEEIEVDDYRSAHNEYTDVEDAIQSAVTTMMVEMAPPLPGGDQ